MRPECKERPQKDRRREELLNELTGGGRLFRLLAMLEAERAAFLQNLLPLPGLRRPPHRCRRALMEARAGA
jgi:hypothetical protein